MGTKWLSQIATIVTPDTLLAWHRKLTDAKGGPVKGLSNGDFHIIETVLIAVEGRDAPLGKLNAQTGMCGITGDLVCSLADSA